jgi:hypothetical protein
VQHGKRAQENNKAQDKSKEAEWEAWEYHHQKQPAEKTGGISHRGNPVVSSCCLYPAVYQ